MKERCFNCDKMAVWIYMPSPASFWCDDCVPRGCSCNLELKPGYEEVWNEELNNIEIQNIESGDVVEDPSDLYQPQLDKKGRELPCCEYEYDADGFDETTDEFDENMTDPPDNYGE